MVKKFIISSLIFILLVGAGYGLYLVVVAKSKSPVKPEVLIVLIKQLNLGTKSIPTFESTSTPDKTRESVFEDQLKPITEKPIKLYTQNLTADTSTAVKIDVALVEVGVEADGSLASPKDWNVGGWYKKSANVGAPGNIIIDGHYDDNYGRPAAFWNLKNLRVGDKVYLVDAYGRTFSYQVTESSYINLDDPDRLSIFQDDKSKSTLTMITCGGVWLPGQSTYSKRLVVKASKVVS